VIEAAILVSRVEVPPREKIEKEIAYLQIAVGKTAGAAEQRAWQWLMEVSRYSTPVKVGHKIAPSAR
jgi:hypothetical protein